MTETERLKAIEAAAVDLLEEWDDEFSVSPAMYQFVDDLYKAVHADADPEWKMRDKVMWGKDPCVFHSVIPLGARLLCVESGALYEEFLWDNIRRPTADELKNWPKGDEL